MPNYLRAHTKLCRGTKQTNKQKNPNTQKKANILVPIYSVLEVLSITYYCRQKQLEKPVLFLNATSL